MSNTNTDFYLVAMSVGDGEAKKIRMRLQADGTFLFLDTPTISGLALTTQGVTDYLNKRFVTDANLTTLLGTAGVDIWVSPNGVDSNNGSRLYPVLTITKALTLVSASRLVVRLDPGAYAEAAPLAWPTRSGIRIVGPGSNNCSIAATGGSVFTVTPGAQTGTWSGYLEGVTVAHVAGAAQNGITFDNTGMGKKLMFGIVKCAFSAAVLTDKSINVATHGDASNGIRIYVYGDGTTQSEIGGAIYWVSNNDGDRLQLNQVWLDGLLTTTNVAKTMQIRLYRCVGTHEAIAAGGNAAHTITSVNSYSRVDYADPTTEVFAALDTNDLTGSQTEVIIA